MEGPVGTSGRLADVLVATGGAGQGGLQWADAGCVRPAGPVGATAGMLVFVGWVCGVGVPKPLAPKTKAFGCLG